MERERMSWECIRRAKDWTQREVDVRVKREDLVEVEVEEAGWEVLMCVNWTIFWSTPAV